MSKKNVYQVEKDLDRLYRAAEPREAFLAGLEERLVIIHKDETENTVIGVKERPMMSWAMVRVAAIVLAIGCEFECLLWRNRLVHYRYPKLSHLRIECVPYSQSA